ncbi:MAG: hypothetical protein SVV80_14125 [Planctomycetota bacterium]|nr:hypothetical protein [Planctomycetota bacterium]
MYMHRGLLCVFAIAVLSGIAAGQTTKPTKPTDKKFDDAWLGEIALEQLTRTVLSQQDSLQTGEKYLELAGLMEKAMLARLTCGHVDELRSLNDMVFVLRACRRLPLTYEITGNGKFARWLIEHRAVSRRLFRAVEDSGLPEDAIKKLNELVRAEENNVIEYPDLAVAFATSLPMEHYRPQPEAASMLDSFRWYTDPDAKFFRYNLKKMPYEISRYLATSRLNIKERKWAVARYHKTRKPAKSYFDVKYDIDHFRRGVPKKITDIPYTLPNLQRVGGVCIEQAYYAAEVNKSLGIPATIVRGRGGGGGRHAWVACLTLSRDGTKAVWDSRTGRYESQLYYIGTIRQPASGKEILDCELALVGASTYLPLHQREQADTATVLAGIVEKNRDKIAQGDLSILEKLAQQYNQSFAKNGKDAKKRQSQTGWIKAERKIDPALVEDLIAGAVERNLAHGPVWELIVELAKKDRLPTNHLDRFFEILVTRTAKKYPDYSCRLIMRIVPTVSDPEQREKVYKNAIKIYGKRPDLQGWILIALGEDYQQQGNKKKALRTYEQAAVRCANLTEIVLEASGRAESMFIEVKRRDLAINMYGRLFAEAKKVKKVHSSFRQQTAHYQLGKRLAQLLIDEGKMDAAKRVEKQIK